MARSHAAASRHVEDHSDSHERPALRSVTASPERPRRVRKSRTRALSPKERLVLTELARGNSTEQIGQLLHMSPHTVRTHVKSILRKLDANTRAHAVALALTENLIEL